MTGSEIPRHIGASDYSGPIVAASSAEPLCGTAMERISLRSWLQIGSSLDVVAHMMLPSWSSLIFLSNGAQQLQIRHTTINRWLMDHMTRRIAKLASEAKAVRERETNGE